MATLYRARDERLDRDVALKIMHPHLAEQDEFVRRFHREARAAARLSSPHVVNVFDEGVEADTAYLVMEYLPGPDLRTELSHRGSFPLKLALTLISQVLDGLGTAHRAGLIHRDVKPENVLLVGNGDNLSAKVTDFGLARAAEANHTTAGSILGTVAYLAPEVLEEAPSASSDIYAVGIMAYELIAGDVPFHAETPIALAYQHVNQTMPRLSSLASWIPASVDSLIGLLTAKDPAHRPATGAEAKDRVDAVLADLDEVVAKRRVPVIPTTSRSSPSPEDPAAAKESGVVSPAKPKTDTRAFTPVSHTKAYEPVVAPTKRRRSSTKIATKPASKKRSLAWRLLLVALLLALTAGGIYWYFTWGPGVRIGVPNVTGQERDVAIEMIENAGLQARTEEAYHDTVKEDRVISAEPGPPADVPKDTVITLTISLGVEQVPVPDVTGMTLEEATSTLDEGRLTATSSEEYSDTVPEGEVISQNPRSGEEVDHSSEIELVVSAGREPVEAPDVTGMTLDEATAAASEVGLEISVQQEYSDSVPEGLIIEQSTSDQFYRGDTLTVTVSLGPELFEVPDVFGLQTDEARRILEDAGFVVEEDRFLGGLFNTVRDQSVPAGDMVEKGTTIIITIV